MGIIASYPGSGARVLQTLRQSMRDKWLEVGKKMDLWMMDLWPYSLVFSFVDELKEQLAVCNEMYSNSYRDSSSWKFWFQMGYLNHKRTTNWKNWSKTWNFFEGEMPFSHDGFEDRVRRYPLPHLSAAELHGPFSDSYGCGKFIMATGQNAS